MPTLPIDSPPPVTSWEVCIQDWREHVPGARQPEMLTDGKIYCSREAAERAARKLREGQAPEYLVGVKPAGHAVQVNKQGGRREAAGRNDPQQAAGDDVVIAAATLAARLGRGERWLRRLVVARGLAHTRAGRAMLFTPAQEAGVLEALECRSRSDDARIPAASSSPAPSRAGAFDRALALTTAPTPKRAGRSSKAISTVVPFTARG
jgi:hypothetical protein